MIVIIYIGNIIKGNSATFVDENLMAEDEEKHLYDTLVKVRQDVEPKVESGQYDKALESMLQMKEPIDLFFDEVMVMTEDQSLRQNRLNLLTAFGEVVLKVGDISRMHQEK